jgi:hypothetical protein
MWRFTNPGNAGWARVILPLSTRQWRMCAQRRIGTKSSFLLIYGDVEFLAFLTISFIGKRVRTLRYWLSLHIAAARTTGLAGFSCVGWISDSASTIFEHWPVDALSLIHPTRMGYP